MLRTVRPGGNGSNSDVSGAGSGVQPTQLSAPWQFVAVRIGPLTPLTTYGRGTTSSAVVLSCYAPSSVASFASCHSSCNMVKCAVQSRGEDALTAIWILAVRSACKAIWCSSNLPVNS